MRGLPPVLAVALAGACADGFSPPGGVRFLILPVFETHAVLTEDLDLLGIRIVRIPSRSPVLDTTAAVDSAGNVDLHVSVSLVSQTEDFEIRLQGIRSSDNAVLYAGFDTVTVLASAAAPAQALVPIAYVGPCGVGSGCVVTAAPRDSVLTQGDSVTLRLTVDSAGVIRTGVPASLEILDPTRAVLSGTRLRALSGIQGGLARVVARIPSDADTLLITVLPPSGANPQIALSASAASLGDTASVLADIGVTNGGTGTLSGLSAAVTYAGGQATGWLAATLDATTAPTTLRLAGTIGTLPIGTYDATVTVGSSLAGVASRTVSVTLGVAPAKVLAIPGYAALRLGGPGNTRQLTAAVVDAFGNSIDPSVVTWTSGDGTVAPTSGTGLVTAGARGRATVVGTAGGAADSIDVLVGDPAAPGDVLAFAVETGRSFRTRTAGVAFPVDVVIDQMAAGSLVGSYKARLTWNAAVLRYDSTTVTAAAFPLPAVNADTAASGVLVVAAVNANGIPGQPLLARVWFSARAPGSDNRALEILEMSGVSPTFTNYWLLRRYLISSGEMRVIP